MLRDERETVITLHEVSWLGSKIGGSQMGPECRLPRQAGLISLAVFQGLRQQCLNICYGTGAGDLNIVAVGVRKRLIGVSPQKLP